MTDRRRITVAGVGAIAAEAPTVDELWARLFVNETAASEAPWEPAEIETVPLAHRIGCFIVGDVSEHLTHEENRRLDRATKLYLRAVDEMLADAGGLPEGRGGIYVGRGAGDLAYFGGDVVANTRTGRRPHPLSVPRVMPNATAAAVGLRHGIHGPALTISTACSTGADAIATACTALQAGEVDWAITGGADSLVHSPHTFAAFQGLGAMSSAGDPRHACRPFDAARDGFVMGEGAAALLLTTDPDAGGVDVLGWASTTDAHHPVAPDPSGEHALSCMQTAMARARVEAAQVSAISAHGTATPLNDEIEGALYGAHFPDAVVTATKSVSGHLLGASAALEIVAVVEMIKRGTVPPIANLVDREPAQLRVAGPDGDPLEAGVVMSNSFAFGGHNTSVVLGTR